MSTTKVYVEWQDNSSNEDGFRLETYLYVSNVGWGWFGTNLVGTYSWFENPLSGMETQFRVRSFNEAGYSDWVYTTVACPATMTVLETPSLLTVSVTQQLEIALTWQNNAIYGCRFSIERKSDTDGIWGEIALVGPFITEYVDTGVKAGETYDYRVKAISYESSDYDSDYSPVAQVTKIQGDINADGNIDLADAILALKVSVGISGGDVYPDRDVNGDGKIGLSEVIYILQKISGLR